MRQSEEVLGYLENAQDPCCIAYTIHRVRVLCCDRGLRQIFHLLVRRKLRILAKRELQTLAFYQKLLLAIPFRVCTQNGIGGTMNLDRYSFCCVAEKTQRSLAFLFCIAYRSTFPLTPRFVQAAFWVCCGLRPHLSLSSTAPTEGNPSLGTGRAFSCFRFFDRRFDVFASRSQRSTTLGVQATFGVLPLFTLPCWRSHVTSWLSTACAA